MGKAWIIGVAGLIMAPAPALPASPVAATDPVNRSWTVYFDFDSSWVTPEGGAVLDVIAAQYAQTPAPIRIEGHTDRMNDAAYDLGLSRRMAESAQAYLVAKGVPASAITIEAYGDTRPRIPTDQGVREPLNRRVEISM